MGWGVMYNGTWVHEFHRKRWSLRYASVAEPRVASGLRLNRRLLQNRSDIVESEVRYSVGERPAAVRMLGFLHHSSLGIYADSIRLSDAAHTTPDTATRRNGTLKYGTGVNLEQRITRDLGVFFGLGWNDRRPESFAFIIGDGALRYQHTSNSAYNRDRGPVWVPSLHLHMQFGREDLSRLKL